MLQKILEELENEEKPYQEQKRRYGEGFRRIYEFVEPGEDIYTLTILSQLRDYEIAKYLDINTGELVEEEEEGETAEEEAVPVSINNEEMPEGSEPKENEYIHQSGVHVQLDTQVHSEHHVDQE